MKIKVNILPVSKFKAREGKNSRFDFRKLGLKYCDLPTMIDNVAIFLRVLTLNIDNRHKERKYRIPLWSYLVTISTASAYFFVFVVSAIWFVKERCVAEHDLLKGIIMFSLCVSSEIGNAKDIIRKIVDESLEFDAKIVPGSRFSNNVLKSMRKAKLRAMVYWFIIMGNGMAYVGKPLFTPGGHFMDNVFTIYGMIEITDKALLLTSDNSSSEGNIISSAIKLRFFILTGLEPIEKSPNFEFGYALVAASVWFLCYVPANVTSVLIVFAGYIEAQMLALTQELLHIWADAEQHYANINLNTLKRGTFVDAKYKKRVINEFITMRLHDIIRKHATNVHILHLLEEVFKGAIAFEFLFLIMGLIAELLGGLQNTILEMPYAFVQVAMDCWTGQRVMDASAQFAAAVYACNWEMFDVPNMKIVLLMLASAQKTMKLSAGGVTMLSFECLMSVVKNIYSAYTTLRSAFTINTHAH
ncbi:uncharacterized protein LOC114362478 [Ostrinia furnacalis]|uniref:uncharacterized protein LOC114362478 n=1 Tax=Ostrinia furnacalis TaxID=93504 RepID=UPI0010386B1D|nr:uncharacterized protein LOC114362478 [Ostrinia furnacalis]